MGTRSSVDIPPNTLMSAVVPGWKAGSICRRTESDKMSRSDVLGIDTSNHRRGRVFPGRLSAGSGFSIDESSPMSSPRFIRAERSPCGGLLADEAETLRDLLEGMACLGSPSQGMEVASLRVPCSVLVVGPTGSVCIQLVGVGCSGVAGLLQESRMPWRCCSALRRLDRASSLCICTDPAPSSSAPDPAEGQT